ncbi:MAG: electron transfer flavoprotein subunit beta/FixA family protein [Eubacteriales bacterium]|nr:electron transfer flavoprotein subunit beta/FixA family protein [Eubacteriales bacterium]
MKILVCVKQVPDTTEVKLGSDLTLQRDFVAQVMNPADESALEFGLRLKDEQGGKLTVLTMGKPAAENMLRESIAKGADEGVLLTDAAFAGADTLATARTLSRAIAFLGGFDLVLFGRRAADGETGQVGAMTAQMLDIPCLSNVIAARLDEALTAEQLTESGVTQWRMPLPAALTFCEWSYALRLPTIMGLRQAKRVEIRKIDFAELGMERMSCGLHGSPTRVIHVDTRPVGVRPCQKMSVEDLLETSSWNDAVSKEDKQ